MVVKYISKLFLHTSIKQKVEEHYGSCLQLNLIIMIMPVMEIILYLRHILEALLYAM